LYEHRNSSVFGNFDASGNATVTVGGTEQDTISGVYLVRGSMANDNITSSISGAQIEGSSGADVFTGGSGFQFVQWGTSATGVNVTINADGSGIATASGGTDTITGGFEGVNHSLAQNIFAYEGSDIVYGGSNNNLIYGGNNQDTISGTQSDGNDQLFGEGGNDTIYGQMGNDLIEGGTGADVLNGGNGIDTLSYANSSAAVVVSLRTNTVSGGDATGDTIAEFENILGSANNDTLIGNSSDNSIDGGGGDDVILARGGNDTIIGGLGDDVAIFEGNRSLFNITWDSANSRFNVIRTSNNETDTVAGVEYLVFDDQVLTLNNVAGNFATTAAGTYAGGRLVVATAGDDGVTLWGPNMVYVGMGGRDNVTGTSGIDFIIGGAGDDNFSGSGGEDYIAGGDGWDYISYGSSASPVNLNFSTGVFSGGDATGDILLGIESVMGTSGNDTIVGYTNIGMAISGGGGTDTITSAGGDIYVEGGVGGDNLTAGAGWDRLEYWNSSAGVNVNLITNTVSGGDAAGDVLSGTFDAVRGSSSADVIISGSGDQYLEGNGGNDEVRSGAGNDIVFGGVAWDSANTGNDTLIGEAGDDQLNGQDGDDILYGGSGNDSVVGGTGTDAAIFSGNRATYTITWDSGNSRYTVAGTDGSDTVASVEHLVFDDLVLTLDNVGGFTTTAAGSYASGRLVVGTTGIDSLTVAASGAIYAGLAGADALVGTTGTDFIFGGADNDSLNGSSGDDFLFSGDGDDTLSGAAGADYLDGGAGIDTAAYTSDTVGIIVNLATGTGGASERGFRQRRDNGQFR
jgi:Ca2+-binding RTX toxin-like protein